MIMTLISTKTIRELEPSLAPASQPGPTIVGGVRCSVDSSGEVFIIIIIHHYCLHNHYALPTLRVAGLDWFVRPGYSLGRYILGFSQCLALGLWHSARI